VIILDTDHLTVLKYARDSRFMKLAQRMADSIDQDFATTAITLEEQLRGWLAEINRNRDPEKQTLPTQRRIVLARWTSRLRLSLCLLIVPY
jgi:hypothetical protein